jgi:FAD/FMN-containing dehydrogenase
MTARSEDHYIDDGDLSELKAGFRGELLRPGEAGYDAARTIFNAMVDKRPSLIARCSGVADVVTAVKFARSRDLLVAVRSGGHNIAGNALCDGGMVIDLSRMKGIRVDPTTHTTRVQPGVVMGEFDRETTLFGLATTGGVISTTGIAGLTLGGGLGWLGRKHGLTCDNLLSADLVTADGTVLTASASQNPDLFWGICGGGGNFGIVTSFEYRLYPIGHVLGGRVVYPLERSRDALRFYREFAPAAPDDLSIYAALARTPEGDPTISFLPCYSGALDSGERLLTPLRKFGSPRADLVGPMQYTELQCMLDAQSPPGIHNYWKSSFLMTLDDAAIDTLLAHFVRAPSPRSTVFLEHFGGAAGRIDPGATAFGLRSGDYNLLILAKWADPREKEQNVDWARSFWDAIQPFASEAVYVNYLEADQEGARRLRGAFGPNYGRLVALKRKFDPTNFFRCNQNINPAAD